MRSKNPVILCILDGWGYSESQDFNAVALAKTPHFDQLWQEKAAGKPDVPVGRSFLKTCGLDVGLPEGQMGNSEVGHMNIGAGRVVYQDLPMIDLAFERGEMPRNQALNDYITALKKSKGTCHLMGLLSDGGVHSHERHLLGLAQIIASHDIPIQIHCFLDGRDTSPQSGQGHVKKLQQAISSLKNVKIATICGRYYAMDRDKRWERTELAYNALVLGESNHQSIDFPASIAHNYNLDITDEFMPAICREGYQGMENGDGFLFTNYRADRARQIVTALIDPAFKGFSRKTTIAFAAKLGMMNYSAELAKLMPAIFPQRELTNVLGKVISDHGLTQLRLAETEKYPHVTFFFNGGAEAVYEGEDRIMVPSPKVATYDLQPEMSALEVTKNLVEAIKSEKYDMIIINYANPDMVGHTGDLKAAIKAVETIDSCLGQVLEALKHHPQYSMLITADHGNCEMMKDPITGGPHTAHTLNKVPLILYNMPKAYTHMAEGRLADLAPTMLTLLKIEIPKAMTGKCLMV